MADQLLAIVQSIAQDPESTNTSDTAGSPAEAEPSIQVMTPTRFEDTSNDTLLQDLASEVHRLEVDNHPDHEDATIQGNFAAESNELDSESVTSQENSVTSQEDSVDQDHTKNSVYMLRQHSSGTLLSTPLNGKWSSSGASTATEDDHHVAGRSMECIGVAADMTSDHDTPSLSDDGEHGDGGDGHLLRASMTAAVRYVVEYLNAFAVLVVQLARLIMHHLLGPMFLGEFGKLTFWVLFTVYAIPWALRTHTVQTTMKNVICETPVIGYVARLEGVECPGANVTRALTMYDNAQDTWQQLQGTVLELLPLSSLFIHAHNRLEDASFAVRYSRYPGCESTANIIESYATNVSKLGRRLEKYFFNITLVTEIMAINLDRTLSIMKEDAEIGLLQRLFVTPKYDINMALASHIEYAEEALSYLYHEGQIYPETMEALHESWKLVESHRRQDIHSVDTALQDLRRARQSWFPFLSSLPSSREERFEDALDILTHLKNVYSNDAGKSMQILTLHLKNILLDLGATQEVMRTAGRYVTNKTHVEHLQYRLAGLWRMSIALRQQHDQFSTDLIQDINAGRGIGT